MNLRFSPVVVLASLFLNAAAVQAKTTVAVVNKYSSAPEASWKLLPEGYVPYDLVGVIAIDNPSKAYQAPYKNIFFQNDRVVVCYQECESVQPVEVSKKGGDTYAVPYDGSLFSFSRERHNSVLKVATVYYWLNRLMDDLAPLGFKPSRRLIVRVDREVSFPSSGAKMENNAFFLDKDWSLTFLPAHLKFALKVLSGGKKLASPALDPSVAMHETMHSVFQQMIGSIINKEIFGLHEAFADYFALDILNDSRLGLIFSTGTPLRKNDSINPYKPGMEAHDLGNTVAAALWKIRGLIPDKKLSKRLVYETILELGRSPYISAGDVRVAHLGRARAAGLSEAKLAEIAAVWDETRLVPGQLNVGEIAPPAALSGAGAYAISVSQQVPDSVTKQWALVSEGAAKVRVIGKQLMAGSLEAYWREVEIELPSKRKDNVRFLISKTTGSILAAFDSTGALIGPRDPAFESLRAIGEKLEHVRGWEQGQADLVGLMSGQGGFAPFMKAKDVRKDASALTINGQKIAVERITFGLETRLLGSILGGLDAGMTEAIASLDAIVLYTVDAKRFPTLMTTEVSPGRRLVGVSKRSLSGVVENSLLSEVDWTAPVLDQNQVSLQP